MASCWITSCARNHPPGPARPFWLTLPVGYPTGVNVAPHFSSRSDEWATPRWLFAQLDAEFGFTLDPCATPENATCARFFTREQDGLKQSWVNEVVFCNPPYGRAIGRWLAKAWTESQAGAIVVCLVPARTDTRWWHEFCLRGEIRFLRGRLHFGGAANAAPFPSAIVVFRPSAAFRHHQRPLAW